jgi:hypothetical protein
MVAPIAHIWKIIEAESDEMPRLSKDVDRGAIAYTFDCRLTGWGSI